MKIVSIAERTAPIASSLRNARIDFSEITASVVAVVTDQFRDGRRVVGHAFNSFGRYGCGGPLRERFIPRLLRATPAELNDPASGIVDPQRALDLMLRREKAGAHAERSMAVGTLELALWDIVGKYHGVPVYELLGGPCRDRIRMYRGVGGATPEAAAAAALAAKEQGFDCLKTGAADGACRLIDTPRIVDDAVARIAAMREAVGRDFDIAIDCHGRFSPAMALRFCDAVADLTPMFVEEPVLPENVDALAALTRKARVPIATGERLYTKWEFREVLEKCELAVVQPDLSHAGGISESKKIAALAEAWYVALAPHCPLGPVALAACLQVDACCPNFLVQEHTPDALGKGYLRQPLVVENGHIALPTGPGLGIELDEEAIAAMPSHDWLTPQLRHADGSVADW